MNGLSLLLQRHFRIEIGQMIKLPSAPDRELVGGIERKEPYTGNSIQMHIGADVQFMKSISARYRRQKSSPNTPHGKRYYSDPSGTIESVYL
jgi:hypothetical protein